MKKMSIKEVFRAAGITNAEYSNDNSALGVSLTDTGILKLTVYTGELPSDLKKYLEYKLPYVQKRAEARKQREAEQKQREAEQRQREAERQAERQSQASAELDKQLVAKLKRANPAISDAEVREMLPEMRKRHFLAEIERQDEASARTTRGLLTVA